MSDARYNGWTNYETWAVALWLDNEPGDYDAMERMAQEAWDDAEATSYMTREQAARYALAEAIREEMTEAMPDLGASMWSDLLGAAVSSVDWYEIADHYLDDVDKTEDTEDAEEDAATELP